MTYPEVGALLGTLSIIASVIVKIFYKPDNSIKTRIDVLETDFNHKLKTLETSHNNLDDKIQNVVRVVEKDNESSDKMFEKMDSKLEKINDHLITLLRK